jgi:uncharacterized repeat protein (TIGR01451 family)
MAELYHFTSVLRGDNTMKNSWTKVVLLSMGLLIGLSATVSAGRPSWAQDANKTLLQAGIAVHSFGVSPDIDDGNATLRIYDVRGKKYTDDNTSNDPYSERPTEEYSNSTVYTHPDWNIDTIGNIYGVAIDAQRTIYATASSNWSPGYVGEGDPAQDHVSVQYGNLAGGDANTSAGGAIYKIDAVSGKPEIFASLPQNPIDFTAEVCRGSSYTQDRHTGAGLGNIAYDKFHDHLIVSNFSDGKIYLLDKNGNVIDTFDTLFGGVSDKGSAYGVTVGQYGKKLYFGTIEILNHPMRPRLFSVELDNNGLFLKDDITDATPQEAQLVEQLGFTQNIGGDEVSTGVWAAYSDLDITPDGELLVGVRVGCNSNFATSYNHGGAVYLLKKDSNDKYNTPSDKTANGQTVYAGDPTGSNDPDQRAGYYHGAYRYDAGAIPLHYHYEDNKDDEKLEYGPDDGYGGVAVWQTSNGAYDLFATSADISSSEGVHGFMQFKGNFSITDKAVLDYAVGYRSVESSTTTTSNGDPYDYKGIGGDVEVLSVLPVSIGSYVWIDNDNNGQQGDAGDECLDGATVTLYRADDMNAKVYDLNGSEVLPMQTHDCGQYKFDNLPEGDYRVCVVPPNAAAVNYVPTANQTTSDNNDSELDSNIAAEINGEYCSGTFGVYANSEPKESRDERGDNADNAHDTWGNMTVDFGFVKQVFDLALIKKLDINQTYNPGDDVGFNITIYNQGTVEATNIKIVDYMPTGMTLHDNNWIDNVNTAEYTIATLAAGASKTISITLKINDNYQGTLLTNNAEIVGATNAAGLIDEDGDIATVDGSNDDTSEIATDNDVDDEAAGTPGIADNGADHDEYDPAQIVVTQTFDLALIKKSTVPAGTIINLGADVTFDITVTNQGTLNATDVNISDYVPNGLILNDANWELHGDTATYKQSLDIAKGASETVQIRFTVDPNFQGDTIINWAEITHADNGLGRLDEDSNASDKMCMPGDIAHNDDTADTNGCDDIDPESIHIGQYFDLALIKKRVGALKRQRETEVTFTITVYNQGTLDATQVQVNDYIPTGLILHDSNWHTANGVATLKTPIASIPKGESKSVSITFVIDADFDGDTIVNNAEIADGNNSLGKPDVDSTPASEDGSTPDSRDNDTADTTGWDDYDPAIVQVYPRDTNPDEYTPPDPDDGDDGDDGDDDDCDCVPGNKANAMGILALILMFMATLMAGMNALPQDKKMVS